MKKAIIGLTLAAMTGMSYAALDSVWTAIGGMGSKIAPAGWYDYKNTASDKISIKTNANNEKVVAYTVNVADAATSSSAGYGFNWSTKTSEVKDLSAYKGVCIAYSAMHPVRLDFKQATIKDYDYNGIVLNAQTTVEKVFVAFENLQQENWGATVAFDAEQQTGIQFAYKNSLAKEAKSSTNTFVLNGIFLGNSCENHAPALTSVYKEHPKPDTTEVYEGDTLKLKLSDIFTDEDDDDLTVSVELLTKNGELALVGSKTSFGLNDVVKFWPKTNTEGHAIVEMVASDGSASVTYQLWVNVHDKDTPPTALDDIYLGTEDKTLTVDADVGVLFNDKSIDNTSFTMALVDSTKHGKLTLTKTSFGVFNGGFTYVPAAKYCGVDAWTYKLTDSRDSVSNLATVTINIACVNDPPTVVIRDSSLIKDVELLEDFGTHPIEISSTAVTFTDPDEDALTIGAYGDSLIKASVTTLGGTLYVIRLTSILNVNGIAKVTLYATDKTDTVKVVFPVTINPVVDKPVAVNDTINGFSDSSLIVSAKKGVLKNDYNPDGETVLSAYLKNDAMNGGVKLATDGSFIYTPTDGWVADSFSYYVVNSLGDTSNVAMVYMNQGAPVALVARIDTTAKEDFTQSFVFQKKTVTSWFSSNSTLYYSVKSDDGKLNPSLSDKGILTIRAVKDSCGDAYVTVSATDNITGIATMKIHVEISPEPDLPHAKRDTIVVKETSGFVVDVNLDSVFIDPEGDSLSYELIKTGSTSLIGNIEGSILTLMPVTDSTVVSKRVYIIQVVARQISGDTTAVTGYIYLDVGGATAIESRVAMPKLTWQRAIMANHGVAKLFDLNGNVLWQGRLPASESEVKNAATRFAGRTILRVNGSQWMLSSEALR